MSEDTEALKALGYCDRAVRRYRDRVVEALEDRAYDHADGRIADELREVAKLLRLDRLPGCVAKAVLTEPEP